MFDLIIPNSYSVHDQLPAPEAKTVDYPFGYFYEHTAKHLIKDTVRIMDNGLHIDLNKVIALEELLASQLEEVKTELASNPLIQTYLESKYADKIATCVENCKSKMRDASYYYKPFNHKDVLHRSYFMDEYAKLQGWGIPEEKLPTGVGKWTVKIVKKYAKTNKVLQMMLDGTLPANTPALVTAMERLAADKAILYNEKYVQQIQSPSVSYPVFNPGSPQQKQELFAMLGIESDKTSKETGLPSWDRDEIERVNRETSNEIIKHFTQCFIDYSFAAIVKNNFIEAFYNFSINDRLYGQYKLLGAKSGRYTSSNP